MAAGWRTTDEEPNQTAAVMQQYDELVEQTLIGPLQRAAFAATDPDTTALQMVFAQVARGVFSQFPGLQVTSRQRLNGRHVLAVPEVQVACQHFTTQVGLLLRLAAALNAAAVPRGTLARGRRRLAGRRLVEPGVFAAGRPGRTGPAAPEVPYEAWLGPPRVADSAHC